MNIFPTSQSILANSSLGVYLIQKYNLSKSTSCQLIKSWVNDTYLIEDNNKKYIFRVYRFNWHSKIEIEAELSFINLLKEKNISVSYPILDKENQWIQDFTAAEGKRHGVLFSFAEGEKRMNLSPEVHLKVGTVIANIHQHALSLELNRIHYTSEVLLENSFQKIKKYLGNEDDELIFILKIEQYISKLFNESNSSQFRKGMVHMDIWADNFNIDKDDNFTIFDFDFCGNGWLIFDYAYHLVMLFITTPDKEIYKKKATGFYNGYSSVLSLTKEEENSIPQIGAALLLFYLGFQCERFKAVFINEAYVKGFINSRIKTWWNYHQLP